MHLPPENTHCRSCGNKQARHAIGNTQSAYYPHTHLQNSIPSGFEGAISEGGKEAEEDTLWLEVI